MEATTFTLMLLGLLALTGIVMYYASLTPKSEGGNDLHNSLAEVRQIRNGIFVMTALLAAGFLTYKLTAHYKLETHVLDWLNLVVRWAHVVLGISWIGASFYFIFLENSLNRTEGLRDELAGNLWAIHGGGFYYVEKYKVAPESLPKKLHWFKFEAYFTWLSGFMLLTIVYYMNAKSFMLDPAVSTISEDSAVLMGIGTLLAGWLIYDLLCRTPLLNKPKLFGIVGFLIMIFISWFLSKYLSGRAAFMHVGALLGTIMAGNVFFVIIPSQKALVAAAQKKIPVDPSLGKLAGLRSLHNNYITLPVIFVMISNHFPVTFGTSYNWIILTILTLSAVAVRHFINLHEKGKTLYRLIPLAAAGIIALIIVTAPRTVNYSDLPPVKFATIQPIIQKRCVQCHSSHPTDETQTTAPNGIMFDTEEQVVKMADRIFVRAVQTKTMPQGNKTGITDAERELIGRWVNTRTNKP
jgi:uncharacterized membrane protein